MIEDRFEQSIIFFFILADSILVFIAVIMEFFLFPIRRLKHKGPIKMEDNLRLNQSKGTEVAAAISGDEQRVPDFQKKLTFRLETIPFQTV